jgi:hypothetical protein
LRQYTDVTQAANVVQQRRHRFPLLIKDARLLHIWREAQENHHR